MNPNALTAQQPQPITVQELDGRIAELEYQRNQAQARCAVLSGQRALAMDLLTRANTEIDRLTKLLNPPAGDAAAPVAPNPDKPLAPAGEKALTH